MSYLFNFKSDVTTVGTICYFSLFMICRDRQADGRTDTRTLNFIYIYRRTYRRQNTRVHRNTGLHTYHYIFRVCVCALQCEVLSSECVIFLICKNLLPGIIFIRSSKYEQKRYFLTFYIFDQNFLFSTSQIWDSNI